MNLVIKCRSCRLILLDSTNTKESLFVCAHNTPCNPFNKSEKDCDENMIFLNEDSLPNWIQEIIEKHEWSKGRLNCLNCNSRIGSFDFVSGMKCFCDSNVLPPVHLIKSKLDLIKQ